jgi:hypothetical protein
MRVMESHVQSSQIKFHEWNLIKITFLFSLSQFEIPCYMHQTQVVCGKTLN